MYRFRIIGAQSLYAYKFSIDSHKLRVIATDGHFIEPVEVDYIIVHSGERYDFILETYDDDSNGDAFWIRATTLETIQQDREHSARAILILMRPHQFVPLTGEIDTLKLILLIVTVVVHLIHVLFSISPSKTM